MISKTALLLIVALGIVANAAGQDRIFHYGDRAWPVSPSQALIGVGHRDVSADDLEGRFLARHAEVLEKIDLSLLPHRVTVFAVRPGVDVEGAARTLRLDPAVTFANPVYHLGPASHPHSRQILTADLCLGVRDGTDATRLAQEVGATIVQSFAWPGTHLLRLPPGSAVDALQASERLRRRPGVAYAHPDWLRFIGIRETIPNDPQFSSQWHLKNTGQGGGTPGADVKATFAWDITTGDPSTIICVIDSGVERNHADITQTTDGYNALCGAGPLMGDPRPTGCSNNYAGNHGTSCAGVAAADINNNTGVAGAAGSCTVMPINLLGSGLGYGTPSMEAACFDYATQNGAAIITNSWGPDGVPWPLPSLVQSAFINSTTNGRGGLGCCIFWAGGNGNESISTDGYSSSQYTMAVGASTNSDVRAGYSDFGPQLDFVAPSSGGSESITTTSTNSQGASNYTNNFGGTSSAAPLAAGVAGLVLAVNPQLSWTEVRDILRDTSVQIDPSTNPSAPNYYNPATGHSSWYGHGRIDAQQAVITAQSSSGGFFYDLTTSGGGDLSLSVTNAPANAELYIPFVLNPTNSLGSGPVFGLAPEAVFTLFYPIGTPPFHVTADGNGAYAFALPLGTVPAGLVTDSRALVFDPTQGAAQMSLIRRTQF